jgi:hypothetical protein
VVAFGVPAWFSNKLNCKRWVKILLSMVLPLMLATFRYNVGYDYGSYASAFNYYGETEYESILQSYEFGDPIGYYIFAKWAAAFGSERIFFFFLALLSLLPPMIYIFREWENSSNLPMILFMYLFGPYLFSFSAIKQGIALGILVFSLTFVSERRIIRFLICVVIASLFHFTAIAFIPVYFFINRNQEVKRWKKILIIVGVVFVMVNLGFVLSAIGVDRFESYATDVVYGRNRSFWLYLLLTVVFIVYRKSLVAIDSRNELLIMMMTVGTMCQILGFFNAFTKRIGEYFTVSQNFLLPQMLFLFNEQSKKIANILLCIYVVVMFLISHPMASSGMGFVPYSYKF